MILFPVIGRELRATARQPFTYQLRMAGVAVLLLVSLLFVLDNGPGSNSGSLLFASLHRGLFWAIWILVPMLTADCLSRERREGTLGLLFLTQLRATEIVMAKGLAHGLRAMTLWLAVLPVLTIPFLLGGVSWSQAVLSVSSLFSSICCALAAGLLASAWSKTWVRAVTKAAILAGGFLLSLAAAVGWVLAPVGRLGPFARLQTSSVFALLTGFRFLANPGGDWPAVFFLGGSVRPPGRSPIIWPGGRNGVIAGGIPSAMLARLFWTSGAVALLSFFLLVVVIFVAGAKTRRSWQEEPPSQRRLWWEKTLCTPVIWLGFYRRWMRRKLERNPVGWLEQRTWSGRLVTWAWFAVLISVESSLLGNSALSRHPGRSHQLLALLLSGSLVMSAAGSFRRERETGVLELLLISPMAESDIIKGRLRGLWAQFLPAFALLGGIWLYFSSLVLEPGDTDGMPFFVTSFLTLPVIGLYFSLRCRNFITAFLAALAVGLLAAAPVCQIVDVLWRRWTRTLAYGPQLDFRVAECAFQICCAVICWRLLSARLKKRAFPMQRSEG